MDFKVNVMTEHSNLPSSDGPKDRESVIVVAPGELYVDPGKTVLHAQAVRDFTRKVAHYSAASQGRELHHAEFVFTRDKAIIEAWGMTHDCMVCRSSTDQALTYVSDNPDAELCVGMLWYII